MQYRITDSEWETLVADMIGDENVKVRLESLTIAREKGASLAILEKIKKANRVSRKETIKIGNRYGHCSRGKFWARMGTGSDVTWAEKEDGYSVLTPGKWVVGSDDGFSRKEKENWKVERVEIGGEKWTIAN